MIRFSLLSFDFSVYNFGMARIYLNDDWEFSETFLPDMTKSDFTGDFERVRIPHSFSVTSFNSFSTEIYQKDAVYRRKFKTERDWNGKRVLLTVGAAAHRSEVFLNGEKIATHECGYTAFTVDLTDFLFGEGVDLFDHFFVIHQLSPFCYPGNPAG